MNRSDTHMAPFLTWQTALDVLREHGLLLASTCGTNSELDITQVSEDSREVGPNHLFVAVRGSEADGHLFIPKAISNGASGIVCETLPAEESTGVHMALVSDSRRALAALSAALWHHPASSLTLIGVTGTNGKTTTTWLLHHLLQGLGHKTGLIGTISYRIGDEVIESTHTTPSAVKLNALLREMVSAGCKYAVMEVSSHALDQYRVVGQDFDVAVFSNLTHDHLDYHKTVEAYRAAKKKLFDDLPEKATALTNSDDPEGLLMIRDTAARTVTYGAQKERQIRFEILADTVSGLSLRLDDHVCKFRLVGRFNAYNLTAAYGVGLALGFTPSEVLGVLQNAPPVPGRFEQQVFNNNITAIVDYAHTPDALENVLETIHAVKPKEGKIWCVFGCGGDRDPQKRPVMGQVAEQYADFQVVTSDNPRTEDPEKIINDIRRGFQNPQQAIWRTDRREAIRYAVHHAQPNDVVLVAGKGHEPYQILGTTKHHFDDREEVYDAFQIKQTS